MNFLKMCQAIAKEKGVIPPNPIAASVDRIAGLMQDLADERANLRRFIKLEQGPNSQRGLKIEITADLSPEGVALMEMMEIVERNAR